MKHGLKTRVGAQRIELFVNGQPENEVGDAHLVPLFQCFQSIFALAQAHVAASDRGKLTSVAGSSSPQKNFQLALPVATCSARIKSSAELRDFVGVRVSFNGFPILTFLLPADGQSPMGWSEGGIDFYSPKDDSQGFVILPGRKVNVPRLRICQHRNRV